MDKAITDLAKALKESLTRMGVCFDQVLDIILEHEHRLADLEGESDIKGELRKIMRRIKAIQDQKKRWTASTDFVNMYQALGVESLEDYTLKFYCGIRERDIEVNTKTEACKETKTPQCSGCSRNKPEA